MAKLLEDIESTKKERSKVAVNASACNTTRSNELASLKDDVQSNMANITNLYGITNDLRDEIAELTSDITSIKGHITSIKSDIKSIKSDIKSIKSDIKSIKSDITSIKRCLEPYSLK